MPTEITWLIKHIPENAGVVAVIALVALFLRAGNEVLCQHRDAMCECRKATALLVADLTSKFLSQFSGLHETFHEELSQISRGFSERTSMVREEIALQAREIRSAVDELKDAIQKLEEKWR